jgi:hypothetical protein
MRNTSVSIALITALALPAAAPAAAQDVADAAVRPRLQDRLRWEMITDGTSTLGSGGDSSLEAPIPNLTGSDATFLFHLDLQPLLNYRTSTNAPLRARKSMHLRFQTGIVYAGRTITARAEPALSPAGEALANQGATITGATTAAPTLTRQRAFTIGSDYSASLLFDADGEGAFAELGVIGRTHFDAFLENERFFEEDGLTYVRVANTEAGGGFFRGEAGVRFRISQFEERDVDGAADVARGRNAADLLVVEGVYQRSGALQGLSPDSEHRWVMRFVATPYVNPFNPAQMRGTTFLLGIEVNDGFGDGAKDIRVMYGAKMDLRSIFN